MNAPGRGAHRAFARLAIALATVLTLVALGVPSAEAQPSGVAAVPWSAQEAGSFWTAERMRNARPLDLHLRRDARPLGAAAAGARPGDSPRRVLALRPRSRASAGSTFGEVSDPTVPGLRQNGVIFFELEGGLARCSGTSVNAPNFSVVFTAGHCVNSGGSHGRWYNRRWVFVPGYRFGQRPFGVFPAKWLDSTQPWLTTGSENADVGAAVVTRNESGRRLGDAVGGAGIAWNLKPNQVFDIHGYPAGHPFDGETQRLCSQTPFLGHDPESFFFGGPLNLAVDCDVTGGASGGGWTIAGGLLNSVTTYGYLDDPSTDFGPYFGSEVARLYRRAGSVR
jgi:V8-like Glu-specific endopeptidase